ncbi:PREDICTED: testis-specific Y-encoded-like protein 1 [Chinchilla lanigera]|uniref:testis-specific Y-encoded-like protein 1 n=1 Tax=Chinchilla lanigera TaxID=34839 RepID=UPI000696A845|nr:PREDICTED: testis-specific Y-encoded-like protein 1 [Chinchilla lanigera]
MICVKVYGFSGLLTKVMPSQLELDTVNAQANRAFQELKSLETTSVSTMIRGQDTNFLRNPYLKNKLTVKKYDVRSSGYVVSLSTPIIWYRGYKAQSLIHKKQDLICNFFTWFSDHDVPESDRIAEIIKEDLCLQPLPYYLLCKGIPRARC